MSKLLLLPLLGLLAMLFDCTVQNIAGGSSQQGNGIVVGSIVSINGTPAIMTQIRIRPINYTQAPGKNVSTKSNYNVMTDSKGYFCISGINPGNYTIEANDLASAAALLKITINGQNDTADAGAVGLKPYSLITGMINKTTITEAHTPLYIQVQGLERLVQVEPDGTFTINDLPEGNFDLHLTSSDSTSTPVELSNIEAISGDTAMVTIPAGWHDSHRLYLNTTKSGANITRDVVNFPVLIRLTATNFNFDQVKENGADIRFTNKNNSFLPYEIEQWDAVEKTAVVWVKVDTVKGDNNRQFITMHWGNNSAADSSNGPAVFDTATGFAGVWHLNGNSNNIVNDATGNTYNGTNSGSTTAEGIIGNAGNFKNGEYIKIPGLLKSPTDITLSAWALTDTSVKGGQEVISLGDAVLIRVDDFSGLGTTGCYNTDTAFTYINTGKFLATTGWHYLTLSINNTAHTQIFYIDGIQQKISNNTKSINYAELGTDTYIGIHGNGKTFFNFNGLIDEVRVSTISMNADWIKLCFMNQKAQDALVEW